MWPEPATSIGSGVRGSSPGQLVGVDRRGHPVGAARDHRRRTSRFAEPVVDLHARERAAASARAHAAGRRGPSARPGRRPRRGHRGRTPGSARRLARPARARRRRGSRSQSRATAIRSSRRSSRAGALDHEALADQVAQAGADHRRPRRSALATDSGWPCAQAAIVIAPIEWPARTACSPSARRSARTASRSSAKARSSSRSVGAKPLRPWPRRSKAMIRASPASAAIWRCHSSQRAHPGVDEDQRRAVRSVRTPRRGSAVPSALVTVRARPARQARGQGPQRLTAAGGARAASQAAPPTAARRRPPRRSGVRRCCAHGAELAPIARCRRRRASQGGRATRGTSRPATIRSIGATNGSAATALPWSASGSSGAHRDAPIGPPTRRRGVAALAVRRSRRRSAAPRP